MRVARIELRHSPTTVLLPLLVLLAALATERGIINGVHLGSNITTSVLGSVQLLGPVCAGLSAWFATRERRRGTGYLRHLGARAGIAVIGLETLSLALPAMAALIIVAAYVLIGAMISGGVYGALSAGGIVAALLGILVHVNVGYLAGRLWPRAAVAPLVTLACYLFVVWNLDQAGKPFYLLAPVTVEKATAFYAWRPQLFLWQSLWLLGLAALPLAALAWAGSRRPRHLLPVAASLGLAGLGAFQLWGYGGHFFDLTRGGAVPLVCTEAHDVRVCTHPAFSAGGEELARTFQPVLQRLALTPAATHEVNQVRRGTSADPSTSFSVDALTPGFAADAVAGYVYDQVDVDACARQPDAAPLSYLVADWLLTGRTTDSSYRAVRPGAAAGLDRLTSLPAQQQWIGAHFEQFRTCQLRAGDFS